MFIDKVFKNIFFQILAPDSLLKNKYLSFKKILEADRNAHIYLAELETLFYEKKAVDCFKIGQIYEKLSMSVKDMIEGLIELSPIKYTSLRDYYKKIDFYCRLILEPKYYDTRAPYVLYPDSSFKEKLIKEQLTGGKGYNLLVLKQILGLPVPDFFIITTNSFFSFLEANNLKTAIFNNLIKIDISNTETIQKYSKNITSLIKNAEIPIEIQNAIQKAIKKISKIKNQRYSIRSSAVSEDSSHSFAGQYKTILNIKENEILDGYKEIVSSKYKPNAIYYRIKIGYCDLETPMACIVQKMILPKVAGVAYSIDPDFENDKYIHIYATKGLGEKVVSGTTLPCEIKIPRETLIKNKPVYVTQDSLITANQAKELCNYLIKMEQHFNTNIDCEWCIDIYNNLYILQARPLIINKEKTQETLSKHIGLPIISKGGITASGGIKSGHVHLVFNKNDLLKTPNKAILVAESMPPEYVVVFERVNAIISEKGSAASHCASVARELKIPFICGVKNALKLLKEKQAITVDADSCIIYKGLMPDNVLKNFKSNYTQNSQSPRSLMLKQLLKLACQLSLVDPSAENFRPEGCRSLHDIIRFVHETSMREMFYIGSKGGLSKRGTKRLISNLPLIFLVLDVGGGLDPNVKLQKSITPNDIKSFPMKYFWQGLSDKNIKWEHGEHFAWNDYDSIMLAGGITQKYSAELASYAILASDYMNLNIRFGYHFTQIDALCTGEPENNYIFFRFAGGGGQLTGRIKRAIFLVEVLGEFGFDAKNTGEFVEAKLKNITKDKAKDILIKIGKLVAATRQMDMYLTEESEPKKLAKEFLKGKTNFSSK